MFQINSQDKIKAAVITPIMARGGKFLSRESRLAEAAGLAVAIDLDVVYTEALNVKEIKPATFFSGGFVEKFLSLIAQLHIELLIADTSLSPIQQRNLEKKLQIKVIDRTALILEIFGERAQTREGNLQVELAHLTYQRSRLVRSWTHLERQRGGAGFLGGPGEKQIELDRRIIDDKIVRIKKELDKVRQTRELQRGSRRKVPYPIVALVGYTNAGKSTLFNLLSGSSVLAQDMLFATLDPTLRKVVLPSGREVIISDTVGFISDLPHELVMAFRATLEEVSAADVLVHVRDGINPDTDVQRRDVLDVLDKLGLTNADTKNNYIEVLNKVDLLSPEERSILQDKFAKRKNEIITVSALTGEGCNELLDLIEQKLAVAEKTYRLLISAADGELLAWLYRNAEIKNRVVDNDTMILDIKISNANASRLNKLFKITLP